MSHVRLSALHVSRGTRCSVTCQGGSEGITITMNAHGATVTGGVVRRAFSDPTHCHVVATCLPNAPCSRHVRVVSA